jgi:hypothetical protein
MVQLSSLHTKLLRVELRRGEEMLDSRESINVLKMSVMVCGARTTKELEGYLWDLSRLTLVEFSVNDLCVW